MNGYTHPLAALVADPNLVLHEPAELADAAVGRPHVLVPGPAPKVSANPPVSSGRKLPPAFRSARELAAELPETVPWVWYRYLARGSMTEVDGRAKAAGKSTFLAHLVAAVLDGAPFLDCPTVQTGVVYLTEQPPTSLRALLGRTGLTDRDDLRLLLWRDCRGASWPELIESAVAECRRVGAGILIVDTLGAFSGVRGDSENDAGAALEAMAPLLGAAADGLAVIVARHDRKSGGEVGDSGRGSGAYTGAVDIVLRLARTDESRPTVRELSALSRFEETPPKLYIDLVGDGYRVLGDEAAYVLADARAKLLEGLPTEEGLTMAQVLESIVRERTTAQSAVQNLMASGEVQRLGAGKRGDPFRYVRAKAVFLAALSAQGHIGSAERNDGPEQLPRAPDSDDYQDSLQVAAAWDFEPHERIDG